MFTALESVRIMLPSLACNKAHIVAEISSFKVAELISMPHRVPFLLSKHVSISGIMFVIKDLYSLFVCALVKITTVYIGCKCFPLWPYHRVRSFDILLLAHHVMVFFHGSKPKEGSVYLHLATSISS